MILYVRAIGRAIRLHRLAVVQQLVHQHHLMGRLRGRVAELGARDVGPGDLHAASHAPRRSFRKGAGSRS